MKVMAREGQLSGIKMVCRQEGEEEEEEEGEGSGLVGLQGERFFFILYKTRSSVFRWEGWGVGKVEKIGIEGNRERIQIKTIVHLEGKDG